MSFDYAQDEGKRGWKAPLILSVVEGYGRRLAPTPRSAAMGEVPVELAGAGVDWAGLQVALLHPGDRQHLAVIAGREDLVGGEHLGEFEAALAYRGAGVAQELDDALPRHPGEEGAVGDRRMSDAVLDAEDVRGGELGDVALEIEHHGVVEAAAERLGDGARAVGIEARGLGVGRRHVGRRPAEARKTHREALGARQWRLIDREREARALGQWHDEAFLGKEHRPEI